MTPTVLRTGPFRFFFYSGDKQEAPHIHVERDEHTAKFWLVPVRLQHNKGFRAHEIREIQKLVEEHQSFFLEAWNDYFTD